MRNKKTILYAVAALMLVVLIGTLVFWSANANPGTAPQAVNNPAGSDVTGAGSTRANAVPAQNVSTKGVKLVIDLAALPSYKLVSGENTVMSMILKATGGTVQFTKSNDNKLSFILQTDVPVKTSAFCGLYNGSGDKLASTNLVPDKSKDKYLLTFTIGQFSADDVPAKAVKDIAINDGGKVPVNVKCRFAGVVTGNAVKADLTAVDFGDGTNQHATSSPGMILPLLGYKFAAP